MVEILPGSLRSVAGAPKSGAEEKTGHSGPYGFAQGRRDDGKPKNGPPRKAGPTKAGRSEEGTIYRGRYGGGKTAGRVGKPWGRVGASQGRRLVYWTWRQSSRGPVLSFRYTSGGQRAAKVAPNHPGTAARSQTIQCEVRIEANTASSPECVCAGVGQPIECADFTQKEKSQ
jgi:hypothetical protein